jgi:hypothetical protein
MTTRCLQHHTGLDRRALLSALYGRPVERKQCAVSFPFVSGLEPLADYESDPLDTTRSLTLSSLDSDPESSTIKHLTPYVMHARTPQLSPSSTKK